MAAFSIIIIITINFGIGRQLFDSSYVVFEATSHFITTSNLFLKYRLHTPQFSGPHSFYTFRKTENRMDFKLLIWNLSFLNKIINFQIIIQGHSQNMRLHFLT